MRSFVCGVIDTHVTFLGEIFYSRSKKLHEIQVLFMPCTTTKNSYQLLYMKCDHSLPCLHWSQPSLFTLITAFSVYTDHSLPCLHWHIWCMGIFPCFSVIFTKGNNSGTSCCFPGSWELSKRLSTHQGKNLLLEEQILSFKSWLPFRREAKMKMARVASPKVYPFTTISPRKPYAGWSESLLSV